MNFLSARTSLWFPNCQSKNKNFKGLSQDKGWAKFAENLRTSTFNKDLSNDTSFSQINLADVTFKAKLNKLDDLEKAKISKICIDNSDEFSVP
jgi:hypothetical protein